MSDLTDEMVVCAKVKPGDIIYQAVKLGCASADYDTAVVVVRFDDGLHIINLSGNRRQAGCPGAGEWRLQDAECYYTQEAAIRAGIRREEFRIKESQRAIELAHITLKRMALESPK